MCDQSGGDDIQFYLNDMHYSSGPAHHPGSVPLTQERGGPGGQQCGHRRRQAKGGTEAQDCDCDDNLQWQGTGKDLVDLLFIDPWEASTIYTSRPIDPQAYLVKSYAKGGGGREAVYINRLTKNYQCLNDCLELGSNVFSGYLP